MKKTALIISLIMLIMMLLTACTGAGPEGGALDNDTISAKETTVEATTTDNTIATTETNELKLVSEGKPEYTVVVQEAMPKILNRAACSILEVLNEKFSAMNVRFSLRDDYIMPNESADNDNKEILVGNTNRPASAEVYSELKDIGDYIVKMVGNKIVIASMSAEGIKAAIAAFIDSVNNDGCVSRTLLLTGQVEVESDKLLVLLANQKVSEIQLYSIATGELSDDTLVWSYKTSEYNIAGIKTRIHPTEGQVIISAYGATSAIMVTYPEGKWLWNTNQTAANPHSPEYIPFSDGGVIAVAASSGAEVRFFHENSPNVAGKISFLDSHGVLWDPQNNCLWVVGSNILRAYTVTKEADGSITAAPIKNKLYTIPTGGAHDLAPVYGDTNLLWVTTGSTVYQFDKTTGKFLTDYTNSDKINRSNIKGVGNFPDGTVISMYPDGVFKSWTTKSLTVSLYIDEKYTKTTISGVADQHGFYKCRVFIPEYQ